MVIPLVLSWNGLNLELRSLGRLGCSLPPNHPCLWAFPLPPPVEWLGFVLSCSPPFSEECLGGGL